MINRAVSRWGCRIYFSFFQFFMIFQKKLASFPFLGYNSRVLEMHL